MSAEKFKVGDRVRVKKRDKFINDLGLSDITLNMLCGKEVVIDRILVGHYEVKCAGCGWHLTDEMLEPITPAHRWTVGQPVWDDVLFNGLRGNIIHIGESPFPVEVKFGDAVGQSRCYSLDGRLFTSYAPTLSAVPYTFELPPQPEPIWIPEKWERVLVRDYESLKWRGHVFERYNANREYPFIMASGNGFKYCIKWDENKVGEV